MKKDDLKYAPRVEHETCVYETVGTNAQGLSTYRTNFPLLPKRFILRPGECPLPNVFNNIHTPSTALLFREFTSATDAYTLQRPPPHLDTTGQQSNLKDLYPELEESDYANISKLTLREFNNKVLNPSTIHAFREIFLQHSYNQISHSSSNKTARENFIFHFAHFDGVLQELQIQLEHADDIAAFSATCTQMRNEFTTFRSHRLDMKRAAESLQKKLNTYRYRSTNYLAETFEDFNEWDYDYETGYYYVYHRNYR